MLRDRLLVLRTDGAERRLAPLCRLVFNFRLIVLLLTLFSLPHEKSELSVLIVALVIAAFASFIPLKYWTSLGPKLVRHPAFLAFDLILTMMVLTVTGPANPFFYFTLGTALLSGVLFAWVGAAIFSALLVGCYWFGYAVRASIGFDELLTYQTVVGFPALYPICAAAGAGVRRLLDRQADTERELAAATRSAAIERERARIAREMHDSLAKSIHGIGFQAAALARWVTRDPDRAIADANEIGRAAEAAASQARELIADLRSDTLDARLGDSIAAFVGQWSDSTGVTAHVDLSDVECSCPERRWEIMSILKEALRNVERHADAASVTVGLRGDAERIVLRIEDDGTGFEPRSFDDLARNGHFGLVGMQERAERVGGRLVVVSEPGSGTRLDAIVPAAASAREEVRV